VLCTKLKPANGVKLGLGHDGDPPHPAADEELDELRSSIEIEMSGLGLGCRKKHLISFLQNYECCTTV